MNDLLVIFGAGASFDCVDQSKSSVNKLYWPPLTRHIFSRTIEVPFGLASYQTNQFKDELLNRHVVAATIGYELRKRDELEKYLSELRKSTIEFDKRKFIALPFYLKELFSEISRNFLKSRLNNNYTALLQKLVRTNFSKLNFITTNYDTILDTTLESFCQHEFRYLNDYLNFEGNGKNFNYLKIHGSINWSYILNNCSQIAHIEEVIEGKIESIDYVLSCIDNAKIVDLDSNHAGVPVFPALAVPLGKYNYVNPQQVKDFKEQNLDIKNLLVIGNSGKDNTIFTLLNEIIKDKVNLSIVDKDEKTVDAVANAFREHLDGKISSFQKEYNCYPGGFSVFIEKSVDEWIKFSN